MRPLVPTGAPIAVVAPSGDFDPARLERGLAVARAAGHLLVPFPDLRKPHRYLSAPDDERLADLTTALTSTEFAAVWMVRGGYGLTRILERIPWAEVRPIPVIGFSDGTPLLDAMRRIKHQEVVHGPVLHSLADTPPEAQAHLFDLLAGRPTAPLPGTTWVEGTASGPLVGGNLSLLAATCGTPLQLDARGCVLALEDVGEAPYRIDRLLQQLRSARVLDGVSGIALGRFAGCAAPPDASWSLDDVLREHLEPLGVPVVAELAFGHVRENHALPLGRTVRLGHGVLDLAPQRNVSG